MAAVLFATRCNACWHGAASLAAGGVMSRIKAFARALSVMGMVACGPMMAQSPLFAAEQPAGMAGRVPGSSAGPTPSAGSSDLGGFGRSSGDPLRLGPQGNGAYDMDRDVSPRPWPENLRAQEHSEAAGVRRFPTPVPFINNPPLQIPGTSDFPWLRPPTRPTIR